MVIPTEVDLDLEQFVARDYSGVVAAVAAITRDRESAADAVQDALVGYLANPPRKKVRNVAAWITVVASNRSRDQLRRRAAEDRATTRLQNRGSAEVTGDQIPGTLELDVDVMAALAQLPLRQRQVCVLHYLLDHSVDTIAEGLAVSPGTIKTLLHRARKKLAALLAEEADHV